jgi:hypothetical protein
MQLFYFHINMSTKEILPYYEGRAAAISVRTTQGMSVQFPVMHLREFILPSGVRGYFCLKTENNKFVSLERIQ